MSPTATLSIRQHPPVNGQYPIRLTLKRPDQPDIEAEANIAFALSAQSQEDLRWYMEDYLQNPESSEEVQVAQIEQMMRERGEELYQKVLAANNNTQKIWFSIYDQLANLRIEISTGIAEAASIPWELLRDPQSDSALAVRVQAFVRVQSNPNIGFVPVPPAKDGRIRLLYVVCRPNGRDDVGLRAVANRLLQGLGDNRARFDIIALRPPTYEQLQKTLTDAKEAGHPFHIVHFDGHGAYMDLQGTALAAWFGQLSSLMLGGKSNGKHGYLLFEHPGSEANMRPVPGEELGQLLHDTGVPVLVLNACQSAMHEAIEKPAAATDVHDEVRAIGSLAQAVVDQGIPAVLGMRYSVFVTTAARFVGELYAALAKGRGFGQAASEARKDLQRNPDRWVGLQARPLQDWFVPVIYEAMDRRLLPADPDLPPNQQIELDPVQRDTRLLRYVPDQGFIGRDETLLMLDRAFDAHSIVLLHAYAGQGKTATAVEFARWYAQTGGLTPLSPEGRGVGGEGFSPLVLFTSFESHTNLTDALNQIGHIFAPLLQANGIEWHALNDNQQRRGLVMNLLRQIPLLWIWDNVELVAGFPAGTESAWTKLEQTDLAEFLKQVKLDKSTKVKILLTSRRDEQNWLGGIAQRIKMPRMSNADAAALALELGKERKLNRSELTDWQPLLNYCAGNPLTLRIIVGQAVSLGLRGDKPISQFIQAVRDGEQRIADADEAQGRDRSLGASLDYGFRHAFKPDELPVIALLHLFQGVVDVDALELMGKGEYALAELRGGQTVGANSFAQSKTTTNSFAQPTVEIGRHSGMDRRNPDCRDAKNPDHPWSLGSGAPCRNDEEILNPPVFDKAHLTHLLQRATETGLLTHLGETWYTIHPALPWFLRQVFARHYDGKDGRSSAEAALRSWMEAIGQLGNYYHDQFGAGNQGVIQFLALEEASLLHARRVSRRHGWWGPVIYAMQGLWALHYYQGRGAEWARLVAEIVTDFCTADDAPISGREDGYGVVMGYRVNLAQSQDRDFARAAALQDKLVTWLRLQAADALQQPEEVALDAMQRNSIRNLGLSVSALGQILMEQNSGDCVKAYQESLLINQRLGDTAGKAIIHFNIGNAYKDIPGIRDLDAAEKAYRRGLALLNPNDLSGRAVTIQQIGMVQHERFREARSREEPKEVLAKHVQAAETHYLQALALYPLNAITSLGPLHNALGALYQEVGQIEPAREHFEKCVQLAEQTGDRYHAGRGRYNIALMYLQSADEQDSPARRRDLLLRAKAYAEAALRDFQSYQGRAADREAQAQQLIVGIDQALA